MSIQEPDRIDDDLTPENGAAGFATDDLIAVVRISEGQADQTVEPEDNDTIGVDGPSQKHA